MTTVVDVQGLSRQFGSTLALDAVDFRATQGRVHGLVGVNGAGKTTLIKHLLGLLRAMRGSVRVLGLDPVREPVNVLQRVGYLSEQREMPEWMRIDELLRYTQAFHPTWDMQYAQQLLDTFGLDPKKKVGGLSQACARRRASSSRWRIGQALDPRRAVERFGRRGAPGHPRRDSPHRGRRRAHGDFFRTSSTRSSGCPTT